MRIHLILCPEAGRAGRLRIATIGHRRNASKNPRAHRFTMNPENWVSGEACAKFPTRFAAGILKHRDTEDTESNRQVIGSSFNPTRLVVLHAVLRVVSAEFLGNQFRTEIDRRERVILDQRLFIQLRGG